MQHPYPPHPPHPPEKKRERDPWLFLVAGILITMLVGAGALLVVWFNRPKPAPREDRILPPTTYTPLTPPEETPFGREFIRQHPGVIPETPANAPR